MPDILSANYYVTLLNSIQDPVCVVDRDYRIKFMNEAARKATSVENLTPGATCHMLTRGKDRPCWEEGIRCSVNEVFASGASVNIWHPFGRDDSGAPLREVVAYPVFDDQGKVAAVIKMEKEIIRTELLQHLEAAEQDLRQEKQRIELAQQEQILKHKELQRLFGQVERAKREWEATMDCIPDMVILANDHEQIHRFNRALAQFANKPFLEIIGKCWMDFLLDNGMEESGFFGNDVEFSHKPSGRFFTVRVYAASSDKLTVEGSVVTVHDVTEHKMLHSELEGAYNELKLTQAKILQQEKMASIGQLAAGVAHEINNPIGFVNSNLGTLRKYAVKLGEFIEVQAKMIVALGTAASQEEHSEARKKFKVDYVLQDITDLVEESLEGVERVRTIVANLKTFSRVDQAERKASDLNECLESTINIVWNELKYKVDLKREYGELPLVVCYPQQLNQVFMNLLMNAAQAIAEHGVITVRTWRDDGAVHVAITDTGNGIPAENLPRLFEPFFTTKEVGKGTGLGLSIAYDIVTKQHHGEISVQSEVGCGTTFLVTIPLVEEGSADA